MFWESSCEEKNSQTKVKGRKIEVRFGKCKKHQLGQKKFSILENSCASRNYMLPCLPHEKKST